MLSIINQRKDNQDDDEDDSCYDHEKQTFFGMLFRWK